jgi:hypothetical protein
MATDSGNNGGSNGGGSNGSGTNGGGPTGGGSNGGGPNSGNNGGSSGTGSTPPPGSSPLDPLTQNLNQIKNSGKPDIKLSTDTKNQYLAVIKTFRDALQAQRDKMNGVQPLGNPGTLSSANQTKTNLDMDVTGPGGITETTDKYLKYLDDFTDTINKAASRLIKSG